MVYHRITYFLKAAEFGSFSKAAAHIFISPQALAKQVELLEEELGGKLFERTPYGVSLTKLGEFARVKFRKIDIALNDAVDAIKSYAVNEKPTISIGIFSSLPQDTLVTPFVTYLLGMFPSYQINLNLTGLNEGKRLLWENKIDLLLTNTHEEEDWGDFECLSFGEYEAKIVVSLLHPWAVKQEITTEDMKQGILLKIAAGNDHYKVPIEDSFYYNIPCKRVQMVNNFDTMYAILKQGDCFAVFPKAYSEMERAKVLYFDYPGREFLFHTALIYHPDSGLAGLKDIVESVKEEFELTSF